MSPVDEFYFYTENFTVGYHGVPLIRNIDIRLKRGEILTLIGPNGAGKTTILKSIIRQLSPVNGVAYLDGGRMGDLTGRELSRKMSVVLTERVRPELMTCEDVVATGRYPYTGRFGILSGEDRRIVRESMELVHIAELAERDFSKTSDGQKQRVMLARAICQEPDIIILDEPTSFLDIKYKVEFLSIIQNMSRSRNLSVIMSLHELDLAERVSDKIACVKGDRIDRFGSPEEIFVPGYIRKLYGMNTGSYDEGTGNLELDPQRGEPRIFVIAGNGKGTPVFRRLQRRGIPFAAGIVWENDLDYPAAKSLAAELVSEKAFCRIRDNSLERAKELVDACKEVICAVDPGEPGDFGGALLELYRYALEQGKLREGSCV